MKILIVTGRFGMGHYSAAEALREELLLETPRPDVEVVDARGSPLSRISGNRLSLL